MENEQKDVTGDKQCQGKTEKITPWFILDLLKPIIKEEFIAQCRYDRTGIRMKFSNGQKFHVTVQEIK